MDPLALLPYALAAAGGRVGPQHVTALVAAGVTLLQRSAPLVRALAGRRSALLLPSGAAWIVALAASDGHGAVLFDVQADGALDADMLSALRVGAMFTTADQARRLPPEMVYVLLDEAPQRAIVRSGDRETVIDLGSHFGLDLEGDSTGPGAPEECLLLGDTGERFTHADVMAAARGYMSSEQFTPVDRTVTAVPLTSLPALACGIVAPLLAGGIVRIVSPGELTALKDTVHACDATIVVSSPAMYEALRAQAEPEGLARVKRFVSLS